MHKCSSQLSPQYTIQLMHTGKQKQMNASYHRLLYTSYIQVYSNLCSYQASLVNRHIRRFTGLNIFLCT